MTECDCARMQTPRAPPLPVAAFLSPILWRLTNPAKFDMYSVGILFLQMVFPNLRRYAFVSSAKPFLLYLPVHLYLQQQKLVMPQARWTLKKVLL